MPTIFLTGATGYIGGHTLQLITTQHPEWNIITLLRTGTQAKIIRKQFPGIQTVVGSLEDLDVVAKCAAEADVVLQLASSHLDSSTSMISSMARTPGKHKTLIQLSSLSTLQNAPNGYGKPSDIIYNDLNQPTFIARIPAHSPEHSILSAGKQSGVSTAIVCPGLIYGMGKGPVRKRATTVPELIEAILKRGRGFVVGEGRNPHHQRTSSPTNTNTDSTASLANFYFLASPSPLISMHDLTQGIVSIAMSHNAITLPSHTIEHLPPKHATQIHPWAPMLWGSNCVGRSDRLHDLGWRAQGPCLADALEEMVDFEVELLAGRDEETSCAWRPNVGVRREEIVACF
ncbi:NAD(P)-binding protein [Cadophora sp. DSE1049]|nr:NAD(P)-binding protein [Cadophora sp. DSE1049]